MKIFDSPYDPDFYRSDIIQISPEDLKGEWPMKETPPVGTDSTIVKALQPSITQAAIELVRKYPFSEDAAHQLNVTQEIMHKHLRGAGEAMVEIARIQAILHAAEGDDLCKTIQYMCDEARKSSRELELEDLLRSAHSIALREGKGVAWDRFAASIQKAGIGSVTARTYRVLEGDQEPAVKLESTFRIGERVKLTLRDVAPIYAYVRVIIFTVSKVRYSLWVEESETTLHNIDSVYVEKVTEPERKFWQFEDDNYS